MAGTGWTARAAGPRRRPSTREMVQKDKHFQPHVLAVPVGSTVDFPNLRPHLSQRLFQLQRPALRYRPVPPGTSAARRLQAPGHRARLLQHPPHHERHHRGAADALVRRDAAPPASSRIADVPPGEYQLHIFHERALPENLQFLERRITVPEERPDAAADFHLGDRLHPGAALEQVRQAVPAGDPTTAPIRERRNDAPAILPAVAACEDPALHLGGGHGAVRHHRARSCCGNITQTMSDSLEEEVQTSFQAYTSLLEVARRPAVFGQPPPQRACRTCAPAFEHRRPRHHPGHRRRAVVQDLRCERHLPGDRSRAAR